MHGLQRLERRVRSQIFAAPFVLTNLMTRYEIDGKEHLQEALRRREEQPGTGIISISNHLSLFDDPLLFAELLGLKNLHEEAKCWWSTPCESNFSPRGRGFTPKLVRYFSDVSRMVFFARPAKKGHTLELPSSYTPVLTSRGGPELMERLEQAAEQRRFADVESMLAAYLTPGEDQRPLAPLNQPGMVEACARVGLGDWLHFFPEGGRSRNLHLKPPRRGVGKVLFHNPDAIVLPVCFYGTQDVMSVRQLLPRPFQRIVVSIGKPVTARRLLRQNAGATPTPELFQGIAEGAWKRVTAMRPVTLARYLGPAKAAALLRAEAPAAVTPAGQTFGAPSTQRPEAARLPAENRHRSRR